jgi:ABC-type polysaccharide/polyol phosphate export permease
MRLLPLALERKDEDVTTAEATAPRPFGLAGAMRSTASAWDLLVAITLRDIRVRYQGTFFSTIWWIARPLALGLVLYFALGRVLRLDIPNYSVFLISALFPWFWFSGAVQQSAGTFVGNGGLIKKVRFPRLILPASAVVFNTAQFLVTLPILVGFVLAAGIDPAPEWALGIPMLLALQFVLLMGLGTLLASINVFFRDLGPMLDVAIMLLFYMSAVIFPLDRVPDSFRPMLAFNPVAPLVDSWRNLFLYGQLPNGDLWPAVGLTAAAVALGLFAFRSLEKYFADAL